jgi:hypothetical protein
MLVGLHLMLAVISPTFEPHQDLLSKPILSLVGIELVAGVVYLWMVWKVRDTSPSKNLLIWVFAVGLLMRASLLLSTPMLEDDYYRYLWDGAVVAQGMNPYAYAPSQILEAVEEENESVSTNLRQLAADSGDVISRINHPYLRTIYPPVAQAAFGLAHWLRPWSLVGWRLVLFGFDVVTLSVLIVILRRVNLPLLWSVIYWWNPLLIKETFNSGHMDVVILPFMLGAVLLAIRQQSVWAAGSLGLAMGAKGWPVVLLPVILRPVVSQPKRLIPALCLFSLIALGMFIPVYAAGFDASSGFVAFGQSWEMNDALFMAILWAVQSFLKISTIHPGHGQLLARVVVGVALAGWVGWVMRQRADDPRQLCEQSLWIVAALFLLSPAQFPWYYVWLVPLLSTSARRSLLLLTALLPLYYLRFYFDARGNADLFDYGIVWLEYVPVWVLLIREWTVERRHCQ